VNGRSSALFGAKYILVLFAFIILIFLLSRRRHMARWAEAQRRTFGGDSIFVLSPPNNYSTASGYLQESYPFNCFLSMKIQERDELLVWGLSIVIVWLNQFGNFLRANNLLKTKCYTAYS
jgi:hypothetical protein